MNAEYIDLVRSLLSSLQCLGLIGIVCIVLIGATWNDDEPKVTQMDERKER